MNCPECKTTMSVTKYKLKTFEGMTEKMKIEIAKVIKQKTTPVWIYSCPCGIRMAE